VLARIWGCRGSLATPGPDTVTYGGNTSCVELVLADGTLVVLDAGTGIRRLGTALGSDAPRTIHLLLTHLHLDHLEGLGFFAPIWHASTELHVWGPRSPRRSLAERVTRYLSPPLFPIELSTIPAQMTFHDVPDAEWQIGCATISADYVFHPGPTVGYRIEENGATLAFIPDHEPALGSDLAVATPDWVSGCGIAGGADVLLHDGQYTEDQYAARVGWGHSSVGDAVRLAQLAEVGRLVLFHHDPLHSDRDLEQLLEDACRLAGHDRLTLAREGMEISL
jgi:phosphoribosyl 1,2-cyclic phosphodiesterase